MSAFNQEFKVLIIGAGLAGLALAQILRKAQIPCEVFERDDGTRSQGWSVGLDRCLGRIQPLLPDDLEPIHSASPNYDTGKDDTFCFYNAEIHQVVGVTGSKDVDSDIPCAFVSRDKVRKLWMKDLHLQSGRRFASYKEDSEGITAFFSDGSSARGSLLVGADGANSAVRGQMLGESPTVHSNYIMLHGNVKLPTRLYQSLLEDSSCGLLVYYPQVRFYILLTEFCDDGEAWFNWNCAWESENITADTKWTQTADGQELFEKTLKVIDKFPPEIIHAVEQTGPEGMQCPPIKLFETLLPSQCLPRGRVTLLGDAAHSMTPFRGMGANIAIIDACDLGELLINGIQGKRPLDDVLQSYEKIMIPRGRENVSASRAAGQSSVPTSLTGERELETVT